MEQINFCEYTKWFQYLIDKKFHIYENCIFCFNPIAENSIGVGEHVIPESIYGFWRVFDVCKDCMKYFGDNVDQLAVKDVHLLNALHKLNLKDVEPYYSNFQFKGKDTIDGKDVKMVRRKKNFKAKVINNDNYIIQFNEKDFDPVGIPWLKKQLQFKNPKKLIDGELNDLNENFKKLEPGEIYNSILGFSIKKGEISDVKLDNNAIAPITPLISKVALSFLCYFLQIEQLSKIQELDILRMHARFNKNLNENLINCCPIFEEKSYGMWHGIRLLIKPNLLLLDICFFGYVNWRIVLHADNLILKMDNEKGNVEILAFELHFEDLNNRKKYFMVKYQNSEDVYYIDF